MQHRFADYERLRLGICYLYGPPSAGSSRQSYVAMFTNKLTYPVYEVGGNAMRSLRQTVVRSAKLIGPHRTLDVTDRIIKYAGPHKNFYSDVDPSQIETPSIQRLFWDLKYKGYETLQLQDNRHQTRDYSLRDDLLFVF